VRAGDPWDDERVAQTILIVDDHAEFRAHAGELLEAAGYQVVGSCPDGESALSTIAALRPDVVLLDVQLPDIDGFGVIERARIAGDDPVVVLTSTRDAADYGSRIARSGAAGFISKLELSAQSLDRVVHRR
jgi:DNA-binding NarL/FixJ family response regulator